MDKVYIVTRDNWQGGEILKVFAKYEDASRFYQQCRKEEKDNETKIYCSAYEVEGLIWK